MTSDAFSHRRARCFADITRHLANGLRELGFSVSHQLVGRLLDRLGYSLQANVKTREGTHHPDRDAQFEHINDRVTDFLAAGSR